MVSSRSRKRSQPDRSHTLGAKHPGKPGTGKPYAGFDEAGVGNVARGAGLRPTAKALDEPPDPTAGALMGGRGGEIPPRYSTRTSAPASLTDLLFKMSARVSYHARRWYVHVASAFPLAQHYRSVLAWDP